jgi:hypothetical protein
MKVLNKLDYINLATYQMSQNQKMIWNLDSVYFKESVDKHGRGFGNGIILKSVYSFDHALQLNTYPDITMEVVSVIKERLLEKQEELRSLLDWYYESIDSDVFALLMDSDGEPIMDFIKVKKYSDFIKSLKEDELFWSNVGCLGLFDSEYDLFLDFKRQVKQVAINHSNYDTSYGYNDYNSSFFFIGKGNIRIGDSNLFVLNNDRSVTTDYINPTETNEVNIQAITVDTDNVAFNHNDTEVAYYPNELPNDFAFEGNYIADKGVKLLFVSEYLNQESIINVVQKIKMFYDGL